MLLRFPWQINTYSLQLLKAPVLISISLLDIDKRLQRHTRTRTRMLRSRKNGSQNSAVIFKTLPFDRNKM